MPISIDTSKFWEDFDPSRERRQRNEQRNCAESAQEDLSNSNLQKNPDGMLTTKPHINKAVLRLVENQYLKINQLFFIK